VQGIYVTRLRHSLQPDGGLPPCYSWFYIHGKLMVVEKNKNSDHLGVGKIPTTDFV